MSTEWEHHPYLAPDRNAKPGQTAGGSLWWKREGEESLHEVRLIDESHDGHAFLTAYEQRPDRTDLIQMIIGDPNSPDHKTRRALVRQIESYDEDTCRVVCSAIQPAPAVPAT
jgi:hypothetical protein